MTTRTTTKTVTFVNPFTLRPLDEVLEPGDYAVETDEELLDGLSFMAYRRILALVHLPAQVGHPGTTRTLSVDPNELDAALMRDAFAVLVGTSDAASPSAEVGGKVTREEEFDHQALDRADDEGMIVDPRQNWSQPAAPVTRPYGPLSLTGLCQQR
jgi:hypothetical protein